MINLIVEEVLRRLKNPPKKALVIFTGGSIGFGERISQLKKLISDGWDLKVVLSKSAEVVLSHKLVKEQLAINDIHLETVASDVESVYKDVDLIILPTLTLNTASKIALCIADNLATSIVSSGIMKGISIIAVKDAFDLENPLRLELGYNKTPQLYISRIKEYMKIMKQYGISLVNSSELYESIIDNKRILNKVYKFPNNESERTLNKKVVTREDVIRASQDTQRLFIGKTAIITSLANETAAKIGVEIIRNP